MLRRLISGHRKRLAQKRVKLMEAAREAGEWLTLESLFKAELARNPRRNELAALAAYYVLSLYKQIRYERCVLEYRRYEASITNARSSKLLRAAMAAYVQALYRSNRKNDARAYCDSLSTKLLRDPVLAGVAASLFADVAPVRSEVLAAHAVARCEKWVAWRLGQLAFALLHNGMEPAAVTERINYWQTLKQSEGRKISQIGYLHAALATYRGDAAAAVAHINRENDALGVGPLRVPEDRLSVDTLAAQPLRNSSSVGPLVTIIMPAYNVGPFLETAIRSALAQTHQNLELIIVDDASTDHTRDIAEEWARRDGRVSVIGLESNGGPYVARNHALKQARGEFIAIHDADDWSHPERISYQLETVQANDAVACILGWLRLDDCGHVQIRGDGKVAHEDLSSLLFARCVYETLGYFDCVRASADTEYRNRIQLHYGKQALVHHRYKCLAFGRLRGDSLTRSAEYGYDILGYNRVRGLYWKMYRIWHRQCLEQKKKPYMGFPQETRDFWAPPAICETPYASTRWPKSRVGAE